MGPQLCSCGNAVSTGAAGAAGACFNGAATLQLRKLSGPEFAKQRAFALQWGRNFAVAETYQTAVSHAAILLASMGPQLCSCGNTWPRYGSHTTYTKLQWGRNFAVAETLHGLTRYTYARVLQWGRNFAVAETRRPGRSIPHTMLASMGPQLCSCGNWEQLRHPKLIKIASMGPQLCSCGNDFLARHVKDTHVASMGPQLCSCGNIRLTEQQYHQVRASMGPQLCSCGNETHAGSPFSTTFLLQWGRNFAVAETCGGVLMVWHICQLQWGRNFAVAETTLLDQVASIPRRFNGAATLQLRKQVRGYRRLGAVRCFNGAATLQLRKRILFFWVPSFIVRSFNGAATLQLRKPV